MGQGASAADVAPAVDRAGFTDVEYEALRQALDVDDRPEAEVGLPQFLRHFEGDLRALVQPLFSKLAGADEEQGATTASWPTFVARLSSLLKGGGAEWSELLRTWAAGVEAEHDVGLYAELAISLCYWCSITNLGKRPLGGLPRPSDSSEDHIANLDSVLAALLPGEKNLALGVVQEHLQSQAPYLPKSVAPALSRCLLGSASNRGLWEEEEEEEEEEQKKKEKGDEYSAKGRDCRGPLAGEESKVLDAGLIFQLRGLDARLWEPHRWYPLYRDWIDGRSFNSFLQGVLHFGGPAVVVVRSQAGEVFGAVSTQWSDGNGKFAGSPECFLFSLRPKMQLMLAERRGGNYVYLNANAKSYKPRGLGFGGQEGYHRLWFDADFEDCYVLESDATYGPGPLIPSRGLQTKFQVARIEVWGFGGQEALVAQKEQRQRDANQRDMARKVDRAKMMENDFDKEMFFGNVFKASADAREPIDQLKHSAEKDDT